MQNIDYNNPNAITSFSDEAHLLFPSTSLSLKQQGQSEHQELQNRTDKYKKCPSIYPDHLSE